MDRNLTVLHYRAQYLTNEWAEIILTVSLAVMARARSGDKGAQDNICIEFRKKLEDETGHRLEHVEWRDLEFEPLRT